MLLGENRELENEVLLALGTHGSRSAEAIVGALKENGTVCTLQGVYRVLKKLHNERVIIKAKQDYSVSLPWMMHLQQFSDHMGQLYLGTPYTAQLLPGPDATKRIWKCRNLQTLNDVWTQLLTIVAQQHKNDIAVSYLPHLWFSLTDLTRWTKTKHLFLSSVQKQYLMIGSQSYADKYVSALLTVPNREIIYFAPPEESLCENRTEHITVIGDYVLTVTIDNETAIRIDTLFQSIQSEEDIRVVDILAATAAPIVATVKIKKHPRLAASLRGKFQRLFGPLK